jgi:ABC-type multidrug transport system ATPase subunit
MHALEVRGLVKRYAGVLAVDRVDLTVEEGQIFGLLGPNGSGKTTTLSCSLGLMRPSEGSVHVLGHPASALHRTRGAVGVVFDRAHVLGHLSVQANMEYARRLRGRERGAGPGRAEAEALERVGIADLARRSAGRLSLGQTKRLAIAMALSGSPRLLVLDEPLSGLDPLGVRSFLRLIGDLGREGLTVLLSSHRLLDVEPVLTHAAVMLEGRVAAAGSLEALCGAGARHVFEVDDLPRARSVVAGLAGVSLEGPHPGGGQVIDTGPLGPAAVNRALVAAGVGVLGLRPARASLAQVFERLVDQAEVRPS